MTTQTHATTEIVKWLRIGPSFHKILTPTPGPKEKHRILPGQLPYGIGPTKLCFRNFVVISTCTKLYSSNQSWGKKHNRINQQF